MIVKAFPEKFESWFHFASYMPGYHYDAVEEMKKEREVLEIYVEKGAPNGHKVVPQDHCMAAYPAW